MTGIILGCDPGITGAVAILDTGGDFIDILDMPVFQSGKRKRVNAPALAQLLKPYAGASAGIELVGAMPRQGTTSMFSLGHSAGCIEGILAAFRISVERVSPTLWKKEYRLCGKPKDAARAVAARLFPTAPLSRKKDIGRAEALLIAKFLHKRRLCLAA